MATWGELQLIHCQQAFNSSPQSPQSLLFSITLDTSKPIDSHHNNVKMYKKDVHPVYAEKISQMFFFTVINDLHLYPSYRGDIVSQLIRPPLWSRHVMKPQTHWTQVHDWCRLNQKTVLTCVGVRFSTQAGNQKQGKQIWQGVGRDVVNKTSRH